MSTKLLVIINLIVLLLIVFSLIFIVIGRKKIVSNLFKSVMKILLTDDYNENLFELVPAVKRQSIVALMENQLRAEQGEMLQRALGTTKKWPNFEPITFIPAQTNPFPIDKGVPVSLSTTIGKLAKKPLEIDIPIMVGPMAYGIALSKNAKLALAKASAKASTAISSGEGPVLQEVQDEAHKFILQFSKTSWSKEESLIRSAHMIEIKLGQGAIAGMGARIKSKGLPEEAKQLMEIEGDEDAIIHEHFFENQTLSDLGQLVKELREASSGVPIGVKIAAGGNIERDIDNILRMGVDFITVDGGQGGTHSSPPILQDDFGIPTLHALIRANNHLKRRKMKDKVSLIVSGGLITPGDFLKALALGADAIYIGSTMLFSINHTQTLNALPFEPPSETIWSTGSENETFDVEQGATFGYNYLQACKEEMEVALRALGKTSLQQVSANDLVSYDKTVAEMANIQYTFKPK